MSSYQVGASWENSPDYVISNFFLMRLSLWAVFHTTMAAGGQAAKPSGPGLHSKMCWHQHQHFIYMISDIFFREAFTFT